MKAKELAKILETYPDDFDVVVLDNNEGVNLHIQEVVLDEDDEGKFVAPVIIYTE